MEIVCDARTLFSTGTCRQRARFLGTWENVLKTVGTSLFVRVLTAISVPKLAQAAGENGRMACFASQSDRPISTEKIETTCEYWKESRSRAAYSGKHLRRNFPPDSNRRHKLHDSGCGPSSAWLGRDGRFSTSDYLHHSKFETLAERQFGVFSDYRQRRPRAISDLRSGTSDPRPGLRTSAFPLTSYCRGWSQRFRRPRRLERSPCGFHEAGTSPTHEPIWQWEESAARFCPGRSVRPEKFRRRRRSCS
jgi:hypothetical protein